MTAPSKKPNLDKLRPWQRLSIKLVFWVGGALVPLTLAAAFIISHKLEQNAVQYMLKTGTWFSDTVKRATRFSMLRDQRDSLHATIEAIGRQRGVEVIRVFNKQGSIMFSSRKAEMGKMVDRKAEACYACHASDRPLERLPQGKRSRIFTIPVAAGRPAHRVLGIVTPIYTEKACYTDPCHAHPKEQKVLGVLDVGLSLAGVDRQVSRSINQVVGFSFLIFLIVAGLVFTVAHLFLNRPLGYLVRATRLITRGDYKHPVESQHRDEIGYLAGSFEQMRMSVKEKTQALEESRRRFQTLFEQVPCYISVQDHDFQLVAVNKMFARDFGAKIGEYCFQVYKGRDSKCSPCAVEKCFRDGQVHSAEETVKGRDGSQRNFLNIAAPITDQQGDIVAVMEMATDVTELRHLEVELRRSEEKYRLFFNNDPNAIFVFDRDSFEILDANDRALSEYGYSRRDLQKRSFLDLAEVADRGRLGNLLATGGSLFPRLHMVRKGGEVFMVNLRASYGDYLGRRAVIAATADITETLKTEQQLLQAAKMATLGEMSAGVAHELNQPLSILSTSGSILSKQTRSGTMPDPAVISQVASEIEAQVQRATLIINHLREFGRKSEVQRSKVDLAEPIRGVFQLVGQQMRVHNVEVKLDIGLGMPPVWGDVNRLEQVLINLVLNARDAIEERRRADGEHPGLIKIALRRQNGQVVLTISDNGAGMSPDVRERIFEPFFTTKEVGKGTGLGLSISYGIMRDYGGNIEVESSPGEGTTFRLFFPAAGQEA